MKSSFYSLTPSLPLFCSCQLQRLDSVQLQAHTVVGWYPKTRLFTSQLLFCTALCCRTLLYNHFARTMRKIQPLLLRKLVYWHTVSNGCRVVAHVRSCEHVFTESVSSNWSIRHSIYCFHPGLHWSQWTKPVPQIHKRLNKCPEAYTVKKP
jgi:hypothetical protein